VNCPACGHTLFDPGEPLKNAARLLRITLRHLETMLARHVDELDPPRYRRLSDHPRLYRVLSTQDLVTLQSKLFAKSVKWACQTRASRLNLTSEVSISAR
jgi:hypothetical protein